MKRLLTVFLLLFVLLINVSAQKTYALLVGVSNYGDTAINLGNTTKDVKEIKKILDAQGATATLCTSKYATYTNISKKLDAIIQLAKPQDKIIFYFSGHGTDGAFVVYGPTLFEYTDLISRLSKARTNSIYCFIDACESGSIKQTAGANYEWGQGKTNQITFFMGCRADEFSFENQWVGNGLFTQAVIKGLRGKADTNGDRKITVLELFRYVYSDVTTRTKDYEHMQHPQLIGPKSHFNSVLTKW